MNAHEWGLLAGTLVPLLVLLISRYVNLGSTAKGWSAALVSIALGAGSVYFAGGINPAAIVTTILAIYGASQAAYRFIFKPLGWTAGALDEAIIAKAGK
jgi:hypothetical protein